MEMLAIDYKLCFYCRENPLTLAGEKGHVELVSLLLSRLVEACYYSAKTKYDFQELHT